MFQSEVFETVISIVLIFLIYSSIVSVVVEIRNNLNVRQKRQMYLFKFVRNALNDPGRFSIDWGWLFYNHPLISSFKSRKKRFPVYISDSAFTDALLGTLKELHSIEHTKKSDKPLSEFAILQEAVGLLKASRFKRLMTAFLIVEQNRGENEIEQVRANIKKWFNDSQDRVVGEYRKSIKRDLFWYGFLIALFFNVNFVSIFRDVINDGKLRNSLVKEAENIVTGGFKTANYLCTDCNDEAFQAEYQAKLRNQLAVSDSLAGRFISSGLSVMWEIPPTPRQIRTTYLYEQIALLKQKKVDTVDVIHGRYCLIKSHIDQKTNEDSTHRAIVALLKIDPDSISNAKIDTVFKKYGIAKIGDYNKELLFFYQSLSDSLNIERCLPTAEAKENYSKCLVDCGCVDRINLERDVIKNIDNKISNYQLEIELYDDLYKLFFKENLLRWICLPYDIVRYNIRSWADFFIYIIGTLIMAIAAAAGTATWFDLLVRLFNVRRAGTKPLKHDRKVE